MPTTPASTFSGLNSTAYRLFKLLEWLSHEALTFEQINQRFKAESKVQKTISQDTVWLYLNTLKWLGCEVSRPSASNQFTYRLLNSSFALSLEAGSLEVLGELKQELQGVLSYKDLLLLDQLAKALICLSNSKQKSEELARYFESTHSVDYEALEALIAELEDAVEQERVLSVLYCSPVRGLNLLQLFPLELYYNSGALMLLAFGEELLEARLFRVDRIKTVTPLPLTETSFTESPWLQACKEKKRNKPIVQLQVLCPALSAWLPLSRQEQIKVLAEAVEGEEVCACLLEVTFAVHDEFSLTQRLLQFPFPFEVVFPASLKAKLQQELASMQKAYAQALSGWQLPNEQAAPKQSQPQDSNPYNNKNPGLATAFYGLEGGFLYE